MVYSSLALIIISYYFRKNVGSPNWKKLGIPMILISKMESWRLWYPTRAIYAINPQFLPRWLVCGSLRKNVAWFWTSFRWWDHFTTPLELLEFVWFYLQVVYRWEWKMAELFRANHFCDSSRHPISFSASTPPFGRFHWSDPHHSSCHLDPCFIMLFPFLVAEKNSNVFHWCLSNHFPNIWLLVPIFPERIFTLFTHVPTFIREMWPELSS